MLEQKYWEYFNEVMAKIKYSVNTPASIRLADHWNSRGYRKALGICYDEGNGKFDITIDEDFVIDSYKYEIDNDFIAGIMNGKQTLLDVICHEIAHTHVWRHGKKHTELTNYLIGLVEAGEPHGINAA